MATVPVIYAASGNCHVYVDATADLEAAKAIVLNAKIQRPGVCNAAETLLVHADAASAFLPARSGRAGGRPESSSTATTGAVAGRTGWRRVGRGVRLGDRVPRADSGRPRRRLAGGGDRPHRRLRQRPLGGDPDPRHAAARRFQHGVDAACVYVNASTRFTDGGEFGMGAEIGNSTQKLHARGPIGMRELCTSKYLVEGDGHVRRPDAGRPASGSSAARSTRRTGHLACAERARASSGSTGSR